MITFAKAPGISLAVLCVNSRPDPEAAIVFSDSGFGSYTLAVYFLVSSFGCKRNGLAH